MKKTIVNQGYTLFECKRVGESMIVVGHNPKAPQPYVTWKAYEHSDFTSFTHGHYFTTYKSAMIDFYTRLVEACEYLPDQEEPSFSKKSLLSKKSPKDKPLSR